MEKKEIKKLMFQAYNLSTQDQGVRSTQSLNEWFEEVYKLKDRDELLEACDSAKQLIEWEKTIKELTGAIKKFNEETDGS